MYEGGDNIVVGGFHNIALALSAGLDIRLSTPVTAIDYSSDEALEQVRVTTASGEVVTGGCRGRLTAHWVREGQHHSLHAGAAGVEGGGVAWYWQRAVQQGDPALRRRVLAQAHRLLRLLLRPRHHRRLRYAATAQSAHLPRTNCWFVNYYPVTQSPILIAAVSGDIRTPPRDRSPTPAAATPSSHASRSCSPTARLTRRTSARRAGDALGRATSGAAAATASSTWHGTRGVHG